MEINVTKYFNLVEIPNYLFIYYFFDMDYLH